MGSHPDKSSGRRRALLVAANILIPLACLIFATGFFPYKPMLPGLATFEDQESMEELELLSTRSNGGRVAIQRPKRVFDSVIFMVVDALRSDFVYGNNSGFTNAQELIRSGDAIPFTAFAAPPTVTMPRVKALTSGSVPSFVDLILNFAESDTSSTLAHQDTWLAQIKMHMHSEQVKQSVMKAGRLSFYGDDTWLKLFPGFFDRSEGTTSFFVSDFTEVDNNVTRHVPGCFKAEREWDALILHYLGLDHIGHKTGPEGPNMLPKQREMDEILHQMYKHIETSSQYKDTLLVVAGDHGMNSAGNHGGSAAGETSTALLFLSPKLRAVSSLKTALEAPSVPLAGTEFDYYHKVQQSDLVPTLAALLGLPIPKNSLGSIIPDFLDLWKGSKGKDVPDPYVQLVYRNALQILEIVKSHFGPAGFVGTAGSSMKFDKCYYSGKWQLQCLWSRAQRIMLAASVDGRFDKEQQAEALLDFTKEAQEQLSATASSYNVSRLIVGAAVAIAASVLAILASYPAWIPGSSTAGYIVLTVSYSVMMFASSYVEEEQHIWYWMTGIWFAILTAHKLADTNSPSLVAGVGALLVVIHRIAISWNQTGQKHAGEPDIVKNFLAPYPLVLWVLVAFAYFQIMTSMAERSLRDILWSFLAMPASFVPVVMAFVFKVKFTHADAPELMGKTFDIILAYSASTTLLSLARTMFAVLGLLVFAIITGHSSSAESAQPNQGTRRLTLAARLQPPLQLILLTQSRVTNIPLFLFYFIQFAALPFLLKPATVASDPLERKSQRIVLASKISLTTLLLAYTSFFQTGGSNAISSIDLSNAYNGVASYNIFAVGSLLFLGNWAGPVWWALAGVVLLQMHDLSPPVEQLKFPTLSEGRGLGSQRIKRLATIREDQVRNVSSFEIYYALVTVFVTSGLAATMVACTVLRAHLFIWTVFSPKYLFAVAWAVGWHCLVGGLGSATLWWAG